MALMAEEKQSGLRERKRQETLERIAETGLKLFVEKGYDGTTLEAIAAEARISARTFFYYFDSKEKILEYWQGGGFFEALRPSLLTISSKQAPLTAVRDCLVGLVSRYEDERSIIVDGILRSTEALRARKQALFVQMETTVFEALCEIWPQKERRASLRIVAMVSIGTMRLAMDAWRDAKGKRRLAEYVSEGFSRLRTEVR
jgi:AcrR family transcriptional regulator